MTERESRPLLARLVREPTLHFLLLAGALFAVSATLGARRRNVVEIDPAELGARIHDLEMGKGAPLDSVERQQVEDTYVDEQILVREALAKGLEDDPRIHDFLVQKMLHVLSADVIQPSDDELSAFYQANEARYTSTGRATVDELIVPTSDALPAALGAQLQNGVAPDGLQSELTLRKNILPGVTADDLTRLFGEETAQLILGATPGTWVGPHTTVRGQHWFRVTERTPTELLPLDVVRDQVRLDWIAEQETARLEERVGELRSHYRVVRRQGGGAR